MFSGEECGDRPPLHDHHHVARLLHALAEPNRLAMVHLLALGEQRVTDVTAVLGLAQSTVSAHLATLRDAGLVAVRTSGRSSWYRLSGSDVEHVIAAAEQVLARLSTPESVPMAQASLVAGDSLAPSRRSDAPVEAER